MAFYKERGASMTEFVIGFPVAFLLVLGILQVALLFNASLVAEYSVFTAARAAAVMIPIKKNPDGDFPQDEAYKLKPDGDKINRIRWAAALPMVPHSPELQSYMKYIGQNMAGQVKQIAASAFQGLQNTPAFQSILTGITSVANSQIVQFAAGLTGNSSVNFDPNTYVNTANNYVNAALGNQSIEKGLTVEAAIDAQLDGQQRLKVGSLGYSGSIWRMTKKILPAFFLTGVRFLNPDGSVKEPTADGYEFSKDDQLVGIELNYLFFCRIPFAARFVGQILYNFSSDEKDAIKTALITGGLGGMDASSGTLIKSGLLPGYYVRIKKEYYLPIEHIRQD